MSFHHRAEAARRRLEGPGVPDPAQEFDREAVEVGERALDPPTALAGAQSHGDVAREREDRARRVTRGQRAQLVDPAGGAESARVTTTASARPRAETGSRISPRGSMARTGGPPSGGAGRPKGRSASRRTMSTSRASRRCWKPSSRSTTSSPALHESRGSRDAIAVLLVGNVRQHLGEHERLVVGPLVARAVPAAHDAHASSRAPSVRASHAIIGVLPVPPAARLPTQTTGVPTS